MDEKLKILVVEDEPAIRTGVMDLLVFHGYEVDGVADGAQGLQRVLDGHYDLVLLDVMMPSMNGFEVCERVREHDRDQAIIMLTAKTGEDDIIQGLRLGADDYISKPFSVTELVLRVGAVLRRCLRPLATAVVPRLARSVQRSEGVLLPKTSLRAVQHLLLGRAGLEDGRKNLPRRN